MLLMFPFDIPLEKFCTRNRFRFFNRTKNERRTEGKTFLEFEMLFIELWAEHVFRRAHSQVAGHLLAGALYASHTCTHFEMQSRWNFRFAISYAFRAIQYLRQYRQKTFTLVLLVIFILLTHKHTECTLPFSQMALSLSKQTELNLVDCFFSAASPFLSEQTHEQSAFRNTSECVLFAFSIRFQRNVWIMQFRYWLLHKSVC